MFWRLLVPSHLDTWGSGVPIVASRRQNVAASAVLMCATSNPGIQSEPAPSLYKAAGLPEHVRPQRAPIFVRRRPSPWREKRSARVTMTMAGGRAPLPTQRFRWQRRVTFTTAVCDQRPRPGVLPLWRPAGHALNVRRRRSGITVVDRLKLSVEKPYRCGRF
jgi:hypothetical protein